MMIEIIGLVASTLVLISMCVKSSNKTGNIMMRVINAIGSIAFIYYGSALNAYSMVLLNAGSLIVNLYHIVKLSKVKE